MIKKLLASTLVLAGLGFAGSSSAHECGDITIAAMNWQSAEVLAEVDKLILSKGYDCKVEMVAGDTMPTFTSMNEKGKHVDSHAMAFKKSDSNYVLFGTDGGLYESFDLTKTFKKKKKS